MRVGEVGLVQNRSRITLNIRGTYVSSFTADQLTSATSWEGRHLIRFTPDNIPRSGGAVTRRARLLRTSLGGRLVLRHGMGQGSLSSYNPMMGGTVNMALEVTNKTKIMASGHRSLLFRRASNWTEGWRGSSAASLLERTMRREPRCSRGRRSDCRGSSPRRGPPRRPSWTSGEAASERAARTTRHVLRSRLLRPQCPSRQPRTRLRRFRRALFFVLPNFFSHP